MAGVIGGLTSVVTQPVKGAQSGGASGFLKGIGKGIVGTVTKPVTGNIYFLNYGIYYMAFVCNISKMRRV